MDVNVSSNIIGKKTGQTKDRKLAFRLSRDEYKLFEKACRKQNISVYAGAQLAVQNYLIMYYVFAEIMPLYMRLLERSNVKDAFADYLKKAEKLADEELSERVEKELTLISNNANDPLTKKFKKLTPIIASVDKTLRKARKRMRGRPKPAFKPYSIFIRN